MKYAAYPALLQIRCKYATKYAANSKYVILYIITGVIYIRYMYMRERERLSLSYRSYSSYKYFARAVYTAN